MLLGDSLCASPEPRRFAPLLEVGYERINAARLLGFASGGGRVGHRLGFGGGGLLGSRDDLFSFFAHRPFQFGSRFSKNAVTPSIASSVESSIVSCERR